MENKASESYNGDGESCREEINLQVRAGKSKQEDDRLNLKNLNCGVMQVLTLKKTERFSPEAESRSYSSTKDKPLDDQLEATKVEMDQVMEENQRLKTYLDRILKDYRTLQVRYRGIIEQETHNPSQSQDESDDIFALSLGTTSLIDKTKENSHKTIMSNEIIAPDGGGGGGEALALGLDYKLETIKTSPVECSPKCSSENSIEEAKEEKAGESRVEKKQKNSRDCVEDEVVQQNPAKRARVSVRIRCDTPTMNDGCQWRKYGQKVAKGNPCPRAYYRCTVAQSCPVRKQVQRCADDVSILITTYEGTHNHPLPIAATAMASTTAAAASMLTSGSSNSGMGLNTSSPIVGSLKGLNYYISDSSRSKTFYLPNSSISAYPSSPTITLDLTSSSSSIANSHFSRIGNGYAPRYPTTTLNFNSSETNSLPISWSNGILSYGVSHQQLNRNHDSSSLSFVGQPQETLYQSCLQESSTSSRQQSLWPDTIAAATKALTSDPNFQSALASALTSIMGNGKGPDQNSSDRTYKVHNNVKSSESFPILSSFPPSASNANKCALGFLNRPTVAGSSQPGGMMLLSQQFPFPNAKNKSNSPHESREHAGS